MRLKVYIAGPISKGDLATNVNQGTAAFIALAKAGFAPWCPHWSVYAKQCGQGQFHEDEDESACHAVGTREGNHEMSHADWMGIDLPWVGVADAVLRLPGESTGADMEVAHARKVGVPVFDSIDALVTWYKTVRAWRE